MKSLTKQRIDVKQAALGATILLFVMILIVCATHFQNVAAIVPGTNEMVSVNNTGKGQGGNENSPFGNQGDYNISPDGRFVSFSSKASNLVVNDTNSKIDIFLRDLVNNTTARMSTSASGVQSNNDSNGGQAVSQTGRYVAFSSLASNLIDGQTITSTSPQIYLRDTLTNTVSLVTQKADGTLGNAPVTTVFQVSSDGRFVVWVGQKNTNLNPSGGMINTDSHLYLADLVARTFTLLSPLDGSGSSGTSESSMSCDGSFIVFTTTAQLDAGDTDADQDIYLMDIRNGMKIKYLTPGSNIIGFRPSISCNGNFITFNSPRSLVAGVPTGNTNTHIYLYNRIDESLKVVDTTTSGILGDQNASGPAGVDDSGNVVFSSNAVNLGASATRAQFFLKHYSTGTLELVSRTPYNTVSTGAIGKSSISSDGKKVVYPTGPQASSLFGGDAGNWQSYDTNGKGDIVMSLTGL